MLRRLSTNGPHLCQIRHLAVRPEHAEARTAMLEGFFNNLLIMFSTGRDETVHRFLLHRSPHWLNRHRVRRDSQLGKFQQSMLLARILIVLLSLVHCHLALAEDTWKDALPFRSLVVAQEGMYPTIEKGSHVFARAGSLFDRNEIKRGDVVYFYRTIDSVKYIFVWRIVAMPGDLLEIDSAGKIKINGKPLRREKDVGTQDRTIYWESNGDTRYRISLSEEPKSEPPVSLTVPSGHVYLLGDNRNHAADSRYHGPVPIDSIYGVIP